MSPLRSFRKRVESVINSDGKAPILSLASALYTISLFYGAGQKLRAFAYRRRVMPSRQLPCKVICVGNITAGGTGKTPMTMYLAEAIRQLGYKVTVVSRGYRGGAETRGGIVSDGQSIRMGPERAGDEPYMMARGLTGIPIVVGKNRYAAGMLAVDEFQPDVIVLDDGYQHLKLKRDVDLVLLDHARPFGNTHMLPRGILREPISSLVRGTACILTRYQIGGDHGATSSTDLIRKYAPSRHIFTSSHIPYWYIVKIGEQIPEIGDKDGRLDLNIDGIDRDSFFGFSGIALNADFQNTVKDLGLNAGGFLEYSDHHRYTPQDINCIQSKAQHAGARRLITTEKDLVRLAPRNPFPLELAVIGVKVSFGDDQQQFMSFIKNQLSL